MPDQIVQTTQRCPYIPSSLHCSLEGFLALMWDAADLLADSVELQRKQDKYMDIHGMVQAMTVQVVGTTAFGYALTNTASTAS